MDPPTIGKLVLPPAQQVLGAADRLEVQVPETHKGRGSVASPSAILLHVCL